MTARESYNERRLDFITWARDQIEKGVYKTKEETKQVEDLVTGEKTWKVVKVIRIGEDGLPLHESNPMEGTGIALKNFEIKSFVYEKKVQAQIAKQQEARMAVETAKAKAEEAKQEELKAIAEGKKNVAIAKYQKEQEKVQAVVDAQKAKETKIIEGERMLEYARLERQAAEETKQKNILEGQGLAEKRRLVLAADGALKQKLAAVVQMNKDAMDALARRAVPQTYIASAGASGGTQTGAGGYDEEMIRALKLMNIQILKTMNVDTTIKGQAVK